MMINRLPPSQGSSSWPLSIIKKTGFTLLEILIALFIFSILSLLLVGALHGVISAQAGTERNAARLRSLQIALLIFSRDVEQAIDRPTLNEAGKQDAAFVGAKHEFTFTHSGFANPLGLLARSTLERTQYSYRDHGLWRTTFSALDQAPGAKETSRLLLDDVKELHFEYIDNNGRARLDWPISSDQSQPLPRAVRIVMQLSHWGKISQLYVISSFTHSAASPSPAP